MVTDRLLYRIDFVSFTTSNVAGTGDPLAKSAHVECDFNDLDPGQFETIYIEAVNSGHLFSLMTALKESSRPGESHPQALTGRVEGWRGT